jgi:hypothetical protein
MLDRQGAGAERLLQQYSIANDGGGQKRIRDSSRKYSSPLLGKRGGKERKM